MDDEPLQPPPLSLLERYRGQEFHPLYTGSVTVSGGVTGHGRASGVARSSDGNLDVDLRLPAEMGGTARGTNPEQLFAAAFAACFHGALNLLGKRVGLTIEDATVAADVAFGRDPMDGGYALVIDLRINMPGVDRHQAEELVRNAERLCPYAKMARQGTLNIVTVVG